MSTEVENPVGEVENPVECKQSPFVVSVVNRADDEVEIVLRPDVAHIIAGLLTSSFVGQHVNRANSILYALGATLRACADWTKLHNTPDDRLQRDGRWMAETLVYANGTELHVK